MQTTVRGHVLFPSVERPWKSWDSGPQLRLVSCPSVHHHTSVPQFPHLWNGDNTMTFAGVVRGSWNDIVHTRLPELAWHRTRSRGRLPFWVFFLPPLHVLTEMTSGIQSTDHWEKEENMPNSRDCSRICWWQGLPVAAWAPPPPPSLNKEAKSLGFCRRPLGQGKPGHLFSLFQPVPVFILPCLV